MTSTRFQSLIDLSQGRTTKPAVVAQYPEIEADYDGLLRRGLAEAERLRDGDLLAEYMLLASLFGDGPLDTAALARLLGEDWHMLHEDIARRLQKRRDPTTVAALARGARHVPGYLAFDENRALAVKCLHGLEDIGTPDSKAALRDLARDADPVVGRTARRMLRRWAQRHQSSNVTAEAMGGSRPTPKPHVRYPAFRRSPDDGPDRELWAVHLGGLDIAVRVPGPAAPSGRTPSWEVEMSYAGPEDGPDGGRVLRIPVAALRKQPSRAAQVSYLGRLAETLLPQLEARGLTPRVVDAAAPLFTGRVNASSVAQFEAALGAES